MNDEMEKYPDPEILWKMDNSSKSKIYNLFTNEAENHDRTEKQFFFRKNAENIAVAWSDNLKANDMAAKTWIIDRLEMYKIPDEIINLIMNSMEK